MPTASTIQTIEMIKVRSSNLTEIGYDETQAKLFVRFIGGKLYQYDPVPPIVFMGLRECQSKGRYLATQIIPFFRCRQVSDSELRSKVIVH
jgi:hypothetical protein